MDLATLPEHMKLYFGHWAPRGVKPDWDKCSMDTASSLRLLGTWAHNRGELVECIAWFDEHSDLRVLVADFDGGTRILMRSSARGWKLTFEKHGRSFPKADTAEQSVLAREESK